tara:strand:+ start:3071 stop:4450 length:1380 start_codon:yes stop_codon:yes gene_type:complete
MIIKKTLNKKFDLIVIGAGSGGLAAAKRAAKYGAKVGIIEGDKIGGTCVIRGCVPKKLMVYASNAKKNFIDSRGYGLNYEKLSFDSKFLLKNIRNEVNRLSQIHFNALNKLDIDIFNGWGRFQNKNDLNIISPDKKNILQTISSDRFLISVGGKPKKLNIPGSNFAWSSNEIFELEKLPKSILIIGGGYIACEFACIFNNLGINVTQLLRSNNLLNGFDYDLSNSLKESMISSGIKLITKDELLNIEKGEDQFYFTLKSGQKINADNFLYAIGREPNLDLLNLKKIDLKMDGKFVDVNEYNQTNISNIFAIGDVIDRPNLTPVAIEQGRVFADNFCGNSKRLVNYEYIPKAVFTNPEIATVGLTEEEANNLYGDGNIKIFKCKFNPMSNTFKKSDSKCLLKLVINKLNDKVLGCHMFGESSAEIIQMASISLNIGVTKKEFDLTMALHPTISEEYVTMY